MGDRSSASAAHAVSDGLARVAAAPVILAGTIALVSFYGAGSDVRHAIGALLLWAFLSGGILDRYARARPTRARGFFAACGAHLGATLRIALVVLLLIAAVHLAMGGGFPNHYVHMAAFGVSLVVLLVVTLAQVRVAVEDRRSALGALLAGGRFAARNPAALGLFTIFIAAAIGVMLGYERVEHAAGVSDSSIRLAQEVASALACFLALAWLATAVSLFQSRLAHAGYTAGLPLTWPESPAAEAIGNAAPRTTA